MKRLIQTEKSGSWGRLFRRIGQVHEADLSDEKVRFMEPTFQTKKSGSWADFSDEKVRFMEPTFQTKKLGS